MTYKMTLTTTEAEMTNTKYIQDDNTKHDYEQV